MMKYFVIGKSLPHTLSPEIHTLLGTPNYGVRLFATEAELAEFFRRRDFCGCNVTIPYKEKVISLLDGVDEEALAVGAVNTVVNRGGKLFGSNTDVAGMDFAIKSCGIVLFSKHVLVLGSGGTAKTACYLARKSGAASVNFVSRTGENNYENCYDLADTQIIVNATPVGMMPNSYASPVDPARFPRLEGVFDCVYNPLETVLVAETKKMGLPCACGLTMLVEQARLSHNLFAEATEGTMPLCEETVTDFVVDRIFSDKRNVVLIGMAGSGKTTVGRRLAELLGRPFADTDEEIERTENATVPELFARCGESRFREIESATVERLCAGFGQVIATGGGAVMDKKNAFYMRSNGVNVLILRNTAELATRGRPLSESPEKAAALFESRRATYFSEADTVVQNDGIEECAARIIAALKTKPRLR